MPRSGGHPKGVDTSGVPVGPRDRCVFFGSIMRGHPKSFYLYSSLQYESQTSFGSMYPTRIEG